MAKINSIDRALDVLVLLYNKRSEMGVSEIAREMGLYKSTVHRTLETLEARGFISKNDQNKYWLGIKMYAMGSVAGNTLPVKNLIQPFAKKLSDKFNEVVNVSILDETATDVPKTLLVLKEIPTGNSLVTINPPLGARSDAHFSAVGKCLLAFTPIEIVKAYTCEELPVYTKNTICSWDKFLQELEIVRALGYAMDDENYEIGLTCVAVPVFDGAGNVITAISVSGPSDRMRNHDIQLIVKELKRTAEEVTMTLQ